MLRNAVENRMIRELDFAMEHHRSILITLRPSPKQIPLQQVAAAKDIDGRWYQLTQRYHDKKVKKEEISVKAVKTTLFDRHGLTVRGYRKQAAQAAYEN